MTKTQHFIVSGHVQGVFYRAEAEKQAKVLELTGWVRNLETGEVEVLASGEHSQLQALYEWLQDGPELANVESVTRTDHDHHEFTDFQIRQ